MLCGFVLIKILLLYLFVLEKMFFFWRIFSKIVEFLV